MRLQVIYNIVKLLSYFHPVFRKDRVPDARICMLNFYRDHSRVILKLISNQFGAAFFAIALGLAASSSNTVLFLCTSIFSILFLLFLNHTVLWEDGAKSRIRVDAGREKYNPLTGLWIGVCAGIPNIILSVITAITFFLSAKDGPFAWEWAGNICGIANVIARLWQGMYLGTVQFLAPGNHYILLLAPLPTILGCFISYWLGLKNCRMFGIFTLERPDGKKK